MTPRAKQIIEALHAERPNVIFEWSNEKWPFGDESLCTITAALRNNLSKKVSMGCDGIKKHSIEEIVDGITTHLVSLLEKEQG